MRKFHSIKEHEFLHLKLIVALIIICVFGCLMVFSASSYMCSQKLMYNFDSMYMLKKQSTFMVIGFVMLMIMQFFPIIRIIEHLIIPIYSIGYISIFLLLTPIGVSSHGATRWIRVLGIQFQVAEVVKIIVILTLSYMVKKYTAYLSNPKLTIRMWIVGGIPAVLLFFISSDLSSTIVVLAIVFGITFVTNKTWKMHLLVASASITTVIGYIMYVARNLPKPDELENVSFRVGRIAAWIDPEKYANNQGYQTLNSLYAIGSGGWFGKGIGMSVMKLGNIPEAQNDMIFAIIVEELGIIGGSILIVLFAYLLYLLTRIAIQARDIMEATIVVGVMIHIGVQAFFNIAVAINLLPNTGIGLPFVSYGGTSILCLLMEMTFVYLIAKKSAK